MKLFFFNVPTSGHVNPSLPLTAGLVERGHEVVYYLTERYRQRVAATGAEFRPTPDLPYEELSPPGGKFDPMLLGAGLLNDTRALLPLLTAVIENEQPDVILYDSMCPWGYYAARLTGRPAVASMALMQPAPRFVRQSLGQVWPWLLPALGRSLPSMPALRRAARQLQAQVPDIPVRIGDVLNWVGDLNICYTSASFQPEAAALGSTYRFVGPVVNESRAEVDFPFDQLDPDRPLIYVTLGSVFSANAAFFRTALAAFADTDYQVVLSTGRRVAPADLAPIPANAIVRDWVPQRPIIARAALCVTHAGMNTVQEGLELGVPQLLAPQQLEQAFVAARTAQLGAGLIINRPAAAQLRQAAGRLLTEPMFAQNAVGIGADLAASANLAPALSAVEALA